MAPIDVSGLNSSVNNLRVGSKELEEEKRSSIQTAAKTLAETIDELAVGWSNLGLSDREAEVAAYRQLGFTNKTIAYMLELSPNTVNEYTRRVNEKIDTARRLVNHAQHTEAFSKNWDCPACGHDMRRSRADIEFTTDENTLSYRCSSCWERFSRPASPAPE